MGTLINVIAVLIGSTIGLVLGNRLPAKIQQTVMNGLGLITIAIGLQMALQTQNMLIVMASVLIGGILGEWWRIEDGLQSVGHWLEEKFGNKDAAQNGQSFTKAFVTTSLIYCVGPLSIVGSILDGLTGDYQPLAIKSMLDGFASMAFGASLGPGVLFSTLTIFIYQGGMTLLAWLFGQNLGNITAQTPAVIELTATGGVLIMAIGLILLELKPIRVANFLPATFIAPLIVVLLEYAGIGLG